MKTTSKCCLFRSVCVAALVVMLGACATTNQVRQQEPLTWQAIDPALGAVSFDSALGLVPVDYQQAVQRGFRRLEWSNWSSAYGNLAHMEVYEIDRMNHQFFESDTAALSDWVKNSWENKEVVFGGRANGRNNIGEFDSLRFTAQGYGCIAVRQLFGEGHAGYEYIRGDGSKNLLVGWYCTQSNGEIDNVKGNAFLGGYSVTRRR